MEILLAESGAEHDLAALVDHEGLAGPGVVCLLRRSFHAINKGRELDMQSPDAHGGVILAFAHVRGGVEHDAFPLISSAGPVIRRVGLANVDEVERDVVLVFRIELVQRVGRGPEIWTRVTAEYQQNRAIVSKVPQTNSGIASHLGGLKLRRGLPRARSAR